LVDVAGAVEKPGVYHLTSDSRVNDALVAANGLSVEADRD
jgi:protein involved in polysaccharide export with SLBB domain